MLSHSSVTVGFTCLEPAVSEWVGFNVPLRLQTQLSYMVGRPHLSHILPLPSRRLGRYQIILLGFIGVWTICPGSLPGSETVGSRIRDLAARESDMQTVTPKPHTIRVCCECDVTCATSSHESVKNVSFCSCMEWDRKIFLVWYIEARYILNSRHTSVLHVCVRALCVWFAFSCSSATYNIINSTPVNSAVS